MLIKQVALILNQHSGADNGTDRAAEISAAFAVHGIAVALIEIGPDRDVAAAAKKALSLDIKQIVVAGGDGTICGVASVLSGSDREMGIIPTGTFNYFGRSLGLPQNIPDAVAVIAAGRVERLNVAAINDRIFLNNTSIGAYAAILKTREGIYHRWGRSRLAAYWSVLKALASFRAPLNLRVTLSGQTRRFRTPLIFAINNAFQLDQMGLGGRECIEQGKMVLLIAPPANRWGLFRHAFALALGIAKEETNYEMLCGDEIEIDLRHRRKHVARDGELERMRGPFRLRILPDALTVFVPADYQGRVR
ncbi:diacylglycerol/lipid kinase family protein [Sulfitobacter aestuarii]|uniref:Diacylglycerol/lipid kinase family protein n=1 Tax=Sulfitobacter aestuarii TaxID=2161676 RepID=A0ABW5TXK8_9RHOB